MNSKTESVHVDEKNGSMVQLIRIIFKNIKLFNTKPDNILLDAGVAAGCALASIK